jgi:adenylylsulfate kinase
MTDEPQVVWHRQTVARAQRETLNGHQGCVVWFTGLSGCGKSTLANEVDRMLYADDVHCYLLDGDNVRHGLSAGPQMLAKHHSQQFAERFGLGFSPDDREENIRRIGAVANLFCDAGIVTLAAFVSPYRRDRDAVRAALRPGDFIEVFVDAPLEICEARDPKGLYKKARAGEIQNFTGIDAPYEPPSNPEIKLNSGEKTPRELAGQVVQYLRARGVIG